MFCERCWVKHEALVTQPVVQARCCWEGLAMPGTGESFLRLEFRSLEAYTDEYWFPMGKEDLGPMQVQKGKKPVQR